MPCEPLISHLITLPLRWSRSSTIAPHKLKGTMIFLYIAVHRYTSNRFARLHLNKLNVYIPQSASKFSLIQLPFSRKPLVVPGTSFQLLRFPNFIECSERHSLAERLAQKQQHRRASHCSCSFVMVFATLGVNYCTSIEPTGTFYIILVYIY